MHRSIRPAAPLAAAGAAASPSPAGARAALERAQDRVGGFRRAGVRVPNERSDASTKRVRLKFLLGSFVAPRIARQEVQA